MILCEGLVNGQNLVNGVLLNVCFLSYFTKNLNLLNLYKKCLYDYVTTLLANVSSSLSCRWENGE